MSGRVVIVSNRLPLSVVERGGRLVADRSIGGLATALAPIFDSHEPLWVGWTGLRRELTTQELESLKLPKSITPVQLEAPAVEHYYDCIANRVLWPALHSLPVSCPPYKDSWPSYQGVSSNFAAAVAKTVQPDDIIWVHDYHMLLLPEYLRQAGLSNRIGFFLHTPFPPPEHLLKLPFASEILDSLCAVDVLGLQTQRDVDNFWACLKAFGSHKQPGLVRAFPIGIDWRSYVSRPEIDAEKQAIANSLGGRRVITSISRLDYTKGILKQLEAVENFLGAASEPNKFVYRLVVAPSRENVPEYVDLKQATEAAVRRINKALGNRRWQPVDYVYANLSQASMIAHYLVSEILLLAPVIDGMNLIAKEYVAARQDDTGMLVLGDQTGAAFQLTDALLVDALDAPGMARAIAAAIAMPLAEKAKRWQGLRAAVQNKDVFWWTEVFLKTLSDPS